MTYQDYLVVLFGPDLVMGFVGDSDLPGITVDGLYYSADQSEAFPAFYDKLVDPQGMLVGICVFSLSEAVRARIRQTSHLRFAAEFDDVDILFFDTLDETPIVEVAGTALAWQQWVNVSGQWILYRTHVLQTNVINVGTYFPVGGFGMNR